MGIAVVSCAASWAAPSWAQGAGYSGPQFGLAAGASYHGIGCSGAEVCRQLAPAVLAHAGWRFDGGWGVDAFVADLGRSTASSFGLDAAWRVRLAGVAAVLEVPLAPTVGVALKGGVAGVRATRSDSANGTPVSSVAQTTASPHLALGLHWRPTALLELSVTAMGTEARLADEKKRIHTALAGVALRF